TKNTIQEIIEREVGKIVPLESGIMGCGRTDAGVHAQHFSAHMTTLDEIDTELIVFKLSKMLPPDIAVHSILKVEDNFHARFSAIRRSYVYHVRLKNDPMDNRFKWVYPYKDSFDLEKLNEAADLILDYEDFTTFSKVGGAPSSNICLLERSVWEYDPATVTYSYYVTANRFLRGMIRLIVGMCINYMEGKISLEHV